MKSEEDDVAELQSGRDRRSFPGVQASLTTAYMYVHLRLEEIFGGD